MGTSGTRENCGSWLVLRHSLRGFCVRPYISALGALYEDSAFQPQFGFKPHCTGKLIRNPSFNRRLRRPPVRHFRSGAARTLVQ